VVGGTVGVHSSGTVVAAVVCGPVGGTRAMASLHCCCSSSLAVMPEAITSSPCTHQLLTPVNTGAWPIDFLGCQCKKHLVIHVCIPANELGAAVAGILESCYGKRSVTFVANPHDVRPLYAGPVAVELRQLNSPRREQFACLPVKIGVVRTSPDHSRCW
jgi:hypothetical protein